MKHFFNKGNLIALRELALRTTAQRVDAQMQDFRREHAVRTTWPATDRLLVCVGPSPLSARLVRATKRLANGLKAEWIAANVETPGSVRLSDGDRRRIEQTLRLAEQLGGQTITLRGENVADEVIAYARSQNVTKIVIGKPLRPKWRDMVLGSVVDDLVRRSGEIDIYVIRGETEEAQASPPASGHKRSADVKGYAWAAGMTAVVSVLGWVLHPDIGQENVLMMYLLGVLWIATQHSRRAAILMSLLSVLAFDLFFVQPHFYLTVHDQKYLITFAVMLITALTISTLAHRIRMQADAARRRERHTQTLLVLSRELGAARSVEEIVAATVRQISDVTGSRTVLLLPDGQRMEVKADTAGQAAMSATELGAARWAIEHQQPAGATTATLPSASGVYVPMRTSAGTVGVVGIFLRDGSVAWSTEQRQLVEALASQSALALERASLAQETRER
jgi:two-component system sensor histidine kinase KdpD